VLCVVPGGILIHVGVMFMLASTIPDGAGIWGLVGGGAAAISGVALLVGGALMISDGQKRVPITKLTWSPTLQLGPTSGALGWTF
jgi:hypothetical protein